MPQKCPGCGAINSDTQKFCGECGILLFSSSGGEAERTLTISTDLTGWPEQLDKFAGKYKIIRQLGRGGMGLVFEAQDLKLKRAVALKLLPGELLGEERARERFIHEAQAASALDHPNICTIYEIGETEKGQIYIAMALCQGESLKQKIRRGPLSPEETLRIALQIAEGLAAAHSLAIIHRDVKPANILISETGQVRLVDFGLAKLAGEARLTRPGVVMGTLSYMSPEQFTGGEVDARSDVWSLGVVMYEMLTGHLPFEADTEPACIYSIVHKKHRPIKSLPLDIPRDLAAVVEKALAKDPEDRFPSAREMAMALKALLEGREISIRKERSARRRAVTWAGLALVVVALAFLLAGGWLRRLGEYTGLGRSSESLHMVLLPLRAVSGNENDQLMADGLSELLNRQLGLLAGKAKDSWIAPLAHVETYEVKEASDARRLLGANLVLSGSIKAAGDLLTVAIDLVNTGTLRRFQTVSKTDNLANVATWREDLALETGRAAGLGAGSDSRSILARGWTTRPAAFLAYVRALGYFSRDGLDNAVKTIEALEETIKQDPSFAIAMVDLARAKWWLFTLNGDNSLISQAENLLQEALKLGGCEDLAHLSLSRIYRGLGRQEEAVREAELVPSDSALRFDALVNLAQAQAERQQPQLAEAAYQEARRLRPRYWVALSYLGLFYFYQGRMMEARDMFLEVTRIVPDNINGLNNLGATYYKLGDDRRAEELFERSNAVKRNPDACSNLGHIYYYRGRYADAVAMNESALSYEQEEPLLWGNLADACHFVPGYEEKSKQAYERAIELAEKALLADRGNAALRSSLAVYLVKKGEVKRALVEMAEALRVQPGDPAIILKSVIVYELSGKREKALEALKKYVAAKGLKEEVQKDPFLADLRRVPEFNEIVGKAK